MLIHALIFLVYLYTYMFYDYKKAHLQAKVFIASITFVLPMINGYIIYTTGNQDLDLYYVILWSQCLSYLFDIIPSYKNKNYNQVVHHLIGLILNYLGYIYIEKNYVIINNIYILEQGSLVPYFTFKTMDKKSKMRNIVKFVHFKLRYFVFLLKFTNTIYIQTLTEPLIVKMPFIMQILWNLYNLVG